MEEHLDVKRKCTSITSKLGKFSLVDLSKEWEVKPATVKVFSMSWLSCERNQFRDVMSEQENG